MIKKSISLQEHQEILYELLYTFDDFCKAHNIRYFLAHGTLLGAIRHQGIIPWDDDADVMMEREEFTRFKKLIAKNPLKGYKAYCMENTKHYYYPFIKFGKLSTKIIEKDWKCVPTEGIGINIDVFPIDGCPGNLEDAEKYVVPLMNRIIKDVHNLPAIDWKKMPGLTRKIFYYFRTRPIFLKLYFKWLFKKTEKFKLKDCKYYYSFWTFYGARNLWKIETLKAVTCHKFGNRELPIPVAYDEILTREYSNYMLPPSEEQRQSTHKHEGVYVECI